MHQEKNRTDLPYKINKENNLINNIKREKNSFMVIFETKQTSKNTVNLSLLQNGSGP